MSNPSPEEIAARTGMWAAFVAGFQTQKEADDLVKSLLGQEDLMALCYVRQFASGMYYVVLIPRIVGGA